MKKILALITSILLFNCYAFAQLDSVTFKIQNQYQAEISDVSVTVLNSGKIFTSNERGIVTIEANSSDSIQITKEKHDKLITTIQQIINQKHKIVILHKAFTWKDLLTPMFYIINGGLWLLLFIVFAETGLFAGFFLPGDSLLFVAGIFSNMLASHLFDTGSDFINLFLIIALIATAGILGNTVGYWFGRKVGPTMYHWKDNLLFKKKYLNEAHDFYEKHGGGAIVIARFIPIIRTFAPIVAGIVDMNKKKFVVYNIIGSLAWSASMVAAGHYLDKLFIDKFEIDLKKHLELIVIIIIIISTAPVILKLIKKKK
ncbi:MAG: VTT domain-containing protein [Chitinophagales bacterium]|nr:VTT domain-containing protein [Chitinophagales bacterium]